MFYQFFSFIIKVMLKLSLIGFLINALRILISISLILITLLFSLFFNLYLCSNCKRDYDNFAKLALYHYRL